MKTNFAKRVLDGVVICAMILIALSVLVVYGFKPESSLFGILFYIFTAILILAMMIEIATNAKEIGRERVPFLIVNIVSLVLVVVTMAGLKFGNFEGKTFAIVVHYTALVSYMFTSLCML